MEYKELNKDNVGFYIKEKADLLNLKIIKILKIKEIKEYSNANFLFEIVIVTKFGNKRLIIKQARSYTKRSLNQKKKFFIDPERINEEVKMIKLLQQIWGKKYVPEIIYFDKKNSILIMNDIGQGKKLLIEDFQKGRVHPEAGSVFGKLFGVLHSRTLKAKFEINSSGKWKRKIIKTMIEDGWIKALIKYVPAKEVDSFINQSKKANHSIVWLDPIYRNIFIRKNSVAFFDFDISMRNDPALDIGIFLSHWIWMMLKEDKRLNNDSRIFVEKFIKSYTMHFKKFFHNEKELKGILERSLNWLSLYLISRTDGKSGFYFKTNALWEKKIRKTAIDLFLNNKKNINIKIINNLILNSKL